MRSAERAWRRAREGSPPRSHTPDGELIARALKRLGLTTEELGKRIGAHKSVLSRARHGELPEKHRKAIRLLLNV